jgi:hypothetical protein
MQRWNRFLGMLALIAGGAQPATALTAPAAHDAYVSLASPANAGAKPVLRVQSGSFASYLKFDLSTLPPGTTGGDVASARLLLFVTKVSAGGPAGFDVVRVTSSWQENTVSGPAAPLIGAVEASGVAVPASAKNGFLSIDVTSAVQDWLDGVLPNEGLALIPSGGSPRIELDSKESKSTSQAPTLEIALTSTGGPVTSSNIVDGTIVSADLANGAVANNNLAADAVTSVKIQDGSITTADLASGAVDGSKLASNSVTSAHVIDGSLTTADIDFTTGNINLSHSTATSGNILKSSGRFLHNFGTSNTFLGASTGNFTMSGGHNVGIGPSSLLANTTGTQNVAVGASALSANTTGSNNTALGRVAMHANTTGSSNTAVGQSALTDNTTGSGNVAVGEYALRFNTTGGINTAVGGGAMHENNSGSQNVAVGYFAMRQNTSGAYNVAVGTNALYSNTTANVNTAVGVGALIANTTGSANTALGQEAMFSNTTGQFNTALGENALEGNTTGQNNIAIGRGAGSDLTTGSDNIAIGNSGIAGESSTIRIGTSGTHTATHIAGIHGTTSTSGITVFVNSSGRLGTTTSSRRFKTDIQPLGDVSRKLLALRPVRFKYTAEIDPDGTPQYGLIAEEVAKVFPDLVVNGEDGKPYTVRYHLLTALLLAELQRQHATIDRVNNENAELRQQIAEIGRLQARLDAVEHSLSPAQRHDLGSLHSKLVAGGRP